MPTISSNTSASPAIQFGYQQLKLQQAKRTAEQAELTARALKEQASVAQANADKAQDVARQLAVRSDQAQGNAGAARAGLDALRSLSEMSNRLQYTYTKISQSLNADDATQSVEQSATPAAASTSDAGVNSPSAVASQAGSAYSATSRQTPSTGTTVNTTA